MTLWKMYVNLNQYPRNSTPLPPTYTRIFRYITLVKLWNWNTSAVLPAYLSSSVYTEFKPKLYIIYSICLTIITLIFFSACYSPRYRWSRAAKFMLWRKDCYGSKEKDFSRGGRKDISFSLGTICIASNGLPVVRKYRIWDNLFSR